MNDRVEGAYHVTQTDERGGMELIVTPNEKSTKEWWWHDESE